MFIGGRGITMGYLCAKFGDFTFSRFGFIVRTESQRLINAILTRMPSAWVKTNETNALSVGQRRWLDRFSVGCHVTCDVTACRREVEQSNFETLSSTQLELEQTRCFRCPRPAVVRYLSDRWRRYEATRRLYRPHSATAALVQCRSQHYINTTHRSAPSDCTSILSGSTNE